MNLGNVRIELPLQTVGILTLALGLIATPVSAFVMEGTVYRTQHDSINVGGGAAFGTSFGLRDTLGEMAIGKSDGTLFAIGAGYREVLESFVSMSELSDVAMNIPIGGMTGGESHGSTSVTVTTDSAGGYQLFITAEGGPAMQSQDAVISDYTPDGVDADFVFTTAGPDAHFGFNPSGTDVIDRYRSSGSSCGSGTSVALNCWDGLSTSTTLIAESGGANHPLGSETVINFRVGIGDQVHQRSGIYTATTTITAIAL